MTLKELIDTLNYRKQGLGYRLYKEAAMIISAMNENFPKTPEEASPELFPEKKGIPMPDNLKEKYLKRGGK